MSPEAYNPGSYASGVAHTHVKIARDSGNQPSLSQIFILPCIDQSENFEPFNSIVIVSFFVF